MKHFESLSQEELVILEDAFAQIAVLISGADGDFDEKEMKFAEKLTHIRAYSSEKWMHDFYEAVEVNFNIKFRDLVKAMPSKVDERQAILAEKISAVNPIIAKLDNITAWKLYHGYQSFAKRIAEAGGGIMGFLTVSAAEAKWIELPMLTPVAEPDPQMLKEAEEREEKH